MGAAKINSLRTEFLGFPVDNISSNELMDFANKVIKEGTYHFIGVLNANKMYLASRNANVGVSMESASIILPENAINMGMRILKRPLKQRNMGGIHTMEEFLKLADLRNYSVYFLGTKNDILEKLVEKVSSVFPGIRILGFRDGFFDEVEERMIVNEIGNISPNFLFVGMGSPKQEIFITKYLNELRSNICLGVGGSLNVIAGIEKPAPKWTKFGLEWLFRSFQDPRKFKRYLVINTYFVWKFVSYFFKRK